MRGLQRMGEHNGKCPLGFGRWVTGDKCERLDESPVSSRQARGEQTKLGS